jgi:hypothetical protein
MRHGNLRALKRRLEALQQTTRLHRGVWVSPEEVAAIKCRLRQKLGMQPRSDETAKGYFDTLQRNVTARVRERLKFLVGNFSNREELQ